MYTPSECKYDESFLAQVVNKCEAKNILTAKNSHVPWEIAQFSHDGALNVFYRKGTILNLNYYKYWEYKENEIDQTSLTWPFR